MEQIAILPITKESKFEKVKGETDKVNHHHHHVVPLAQISLTLSRHFSLSFIASGRSSSLHPVSSRSCCMYVRVGRPTFAQPYVGVHRSRSLMNSSLLLQLCPACLVRLTWIALVMGSKWLYSWCLGCCRQDLFNIARNIFVCNCRLASSPAVLLGSWCLVGCCRQDSFNIARSILPNGKSH